MKKEKVYFKYGNPHIFVMNANMHSNSLCFWANLSKSLCSIEQISLRETKKYLIKHIPQYFAKISKRNNFGNISKYFKFFSSSFSWRFQKRCLKRKKGVKSIYFNFVSLLLWQYFPPCFSGSSSIDVIVFARDLRAK